MGCFLGCFGSSKDGNKRRKHRKNRVLNQDQRHVSQNPIQHKFSAEQAILEKPINLVSESRDSPEEQLSLSARKKVTFDTNVKTYEPVVVVHESTESLSEINKVGEKEKEESLAKSSESHSLIESDSITSSIGSYPPNHRYQNCRDSDDEGEELDNEESDEEDDDDDDDELVNYDYGDEVDDNRVLGGEVWSKSTSILPARAILEEVDSSPMIMSGLIEQESKPIGFNRNARDRGVYVHSVLNPVENLSQWKAVKSKGTTTPLNPDKENSKVDQEAQPFTTSFDSEPSFKFKFDKPKNSNQEIAVDASLSNWLVSSETTPIVRKTSFTGFETSKSEKSMSQGSNSVRSFEDRPILGALTVEELKQFSASASPRRSPSRSPDDMAIIGTVGTYWNHAGSVEDSGSASSFKGIPNTTSKYREDKRVNWHSTPFETRLERALNRGSAEV